MKHLYKRLIICFSVVLSFSGYGQTFIQSRNIGGTSVGNDFLQDIVTDNADNSYALGYFTDKITNPTTIGSSGNTANNVFIFKYGTSGSLTWSKLINSSGSNNINGYRIAVDNAGNVFIAGSCSGSSIFFNGFDAKGTLAGPNSLQTDCFVAQYNSAGALVWVRAIGSAPVEDEILDLSLDSNGDVYVTGYISDNAIVYGRDYGATQANLATINSQGGTAGLTDIVVAKFSNAGTYQWGYSLGSVAGSERGTSITNDASNNAFVGGQFFNTTNFNSSGTANLTASTGSGDGFIAKYTSAGSYLNVGQISGSNVKNVNRMHVGSSGALNVSGSFTGSINADLRSGNTLTLTSAGGLDILFAKYDLNTFAPIAVKNIGGSGDDEGFGIKGDASGNFYLTGYFSGSTVNFNPLGTALNLTSAGGKDIFISQYNNSGVNGWAFPVGGTSDDQGRSIDFNASAYIYGGGYYASSSVGDFDPGAGVNTLANSGVVNSYIAKYQQCSTPVITTQPLATQTICAGATLNLSITVTGSGLTYQWKKGGTSLVNGGTISGATSSALIITPSAAGDAGTYTCVASSCGNNVTSSNAVVTINTPPAIQTQPTASSICSGQNASFTVSATGTSLTYQWKLNGVAISNGAVYSGVNAATLNLIAPIAAQAGNYTCDVTGSCTPVVTTTAVALTISPAVSITTQPANLSACLGGNATFTIGATGVTSYAWQKNNVNLSDGGSISGSSTSTLTITGVAAGDAANYRCVLTGACGSTNSNAATLTITSAPVVTTQPIANQTICAGQSATFTIVASGGVSYQWMKNGTALSNTGNVSGALTSSLLLTSLSASDAATYTCVVTGACSPTATSNNSVLNINLLPSITTQPTAQTICSSQSTSFTISATGSNLSYQWQKNNVNISDGVIYSGSTTTTLTITAATSAEAANYTCIVSGSCSPSVTSAAAALIVNSTAAITSNPASDVVCSGQAATFSISTSGSGITYQWQKNGVAISNGGTISGATSSTLSISSVVAGDAANYLCIINNACSGTLNSTSATLTVNSLPTIVTQPSDVTICSSSNVSFNVSATGTGLTYQWQLGGVSLTDGGVISGSTTNTLSISPAGAGNAGTYTCIVNGTCNNPVTSTGAVLSVGGTAAITTQPANISVCSGTNAVFTITVSGTGLTYQWQKNSVNLSNGGKISGVTTSSFTITGADATDVATYSCITGNACSGSLNSSTAQLSINSLPAITTQPTSVSTCSGTSATFTIAATGTGITYQWLKSGVNMSDGGNVSGSLTNQLTLSSVSASDAASYTCQVSGTCTPSVVSSGATLTVSAGISIISQPTSKIACTGSSTAFLCQATGGTITYQWMKNGVAMVDGSNISGSQTSTLTINSVSALDSATYVCNLTSNCSAGTASQAAKLTVTTTSVITSQPTSLAICKGTDAVFSISATGAGLAYQWSINGTPLSDGVSVSGSATSNLTIYNTGIANNGTYSCDITSQCNFISSIPATLVVNVPAAITAQPNNLSACPGDSVTFQIVTTGTNLTYQWTKAGVALSDGGNIYNSATPILSVSHVSASDVASYSCVVTAACGPNVTSSVASLVLSSSPVIITQPTNQLTCIGQPLSLSVIVSNPSNVTFQWQKNGVNTVDGGTMSGSTTSTLTVSSAANSDAGTYSCVVSNACSAPVTTNTATVTTTTSSTITSQPVNANICSSQTALFNVSVSNTGVTYQWQFKSSSGGTFVNLTDGGKISGSATGNLVVSKATINEQGTYQCQITDPCGTNQLSAGAALIINSPNISQQPLSQSVCLGSVGKINIIASGSTLSYQWYKNGIVISNGGRISGATTSALQINGLIATDAGGYSCQVSGICSPVALSDTATLTISSCTGISAADLTDSNIIIYPNPTATISTIEFKNRNGQEANVTIFDALGNLVAEVQYVLKSDLEQYVLPMDNMAQGMYFVQIQIGSDYYSNKVERIQ